MTYIVDNTAEIAFPGLHVSNVSAYVGLQARKSSMISTMKPMKVMLPYGGRWRLHAPTVPSGLCRNERQARVQSLGVPQKRVIKFRGLR